MRGGVGRDMYRFCTFTIASIASVAGFPGVGGIVKDFFQNILLTALVVFIRHYVLWFRRIVPILWMNIFNRICPGRRGSVRSIAGASSFP
jgi:hypothetical protein